MVVLKRIKTVAVMAIAALLLTLCGCTPPTIMMCSGSEASPAQCLETLFSSLSTGDYETADACISNYSTLGFSDISGEGISSELYGYLTTSRSYRVTGEISSTASDAVLSVELTTLDYRKLETALTEKTTERVHQMQMDGNEVSGDEEINAVIEEMLSQMMTAPEEYYSTGQFEISFRNIDGEWKLICSEAFYSALIGYAV